MLFIMNFLMILFLNWKLKLMSEFHFFIFMYIMVHIKFMIFIILKFSLKEKWLFYFCSSILSLMILVPYWFLFMVCSFFGLDFYHWFFSSFCIDESVSLWTRIIISQGYNQYMFKFNLIFLLFFIFLMINFSNLYFFYTSKDIKETFSYYSLMEKMKLFYLLTPFSFFSLILMFFLLIFNMCNLLHIFLNIFLMLNFYYTNIIVFWSLMIFLSILYFLFTKKN